MLILIAFVVGGTLGFLVAGFAFASDDNWYEGAADEYQRSYEDGFREGRTRRTLSEGHNE